MKHGKKILAAALAALLALSVLTACSGSGSGAIKGEKLAKLIGAFWEDSVEYDSSLNKTAENAMKAVKAAVAKDPAITMDNAILDDEDGTLFRHYHPGNGDCKREFTPAGAELKKALEVEKANEEKDVYVALTNTKNIKDETSALALVISSELVETNSGSCDYYRMGYYESSDYILVVLVGEEES